MGIGDLSPMQSVRKCCFGRIHTALRGLREAFPGPRLVSAALLPEAYLLSLRDEPGQPDQVVGGAAEDEQPVDIL
jgi:hypothetical protein